MRLYKKDTEGRLRFIDVVADGPELIQRSGLIGTDSPIEHRKVCTPKNVGKSNETTPTQQAFSERDSLLLEKKDEGYFKTAEEAEETAVILPMLAKDYKKEFRKIDWAKDEVYAQPKLDGMRCLAHLSANGNVVLKSRQGKVITTVPHIVEILRTIRQDVILDGELYAHGLSFQENMKLIKKHRPGESEAIGYSVYDSVSPHAFVDRIALANQCAGAKLSFKGRGLINVPTARIYSEEDLKRCHGLNIGEGYEGTIVRWGFRGYEINKRSEHLLKYKDFIDIACPIIDIEPAVQRPEWAVPVLTHNGKTFRAGMKYSHEDRKEFLKNKQNYIGKIAEIRFFEWTDEGMPRFPVMVGVRLDK